MAEVWFHRFALLGTLLTLVIVMSGAWVRLTDAGLGCPDWPGCYGRLTPPVAEHEIAASNAQFPGTPVDSGKAWREMLHRYAIPVLGGIILLLAAIALVNKKDLLMPLWLPVLLLPLLAGQAMLGMLTVTLQLKPIVVMGHLLGGMTMLAALGWLTLRTRPRSALYLSARSKLRAAALVALLVVFAQIALGGWTSANYAATACPDFPTCRAQWWPAMDFDAAFVPWRGLGADDLAGDGGLMARTAIHMTHRLGALVTLVVVGSIGLIAATQGRDRATRVAGAAVVVVLLTQVGLGIAIVVNGLPLAPAVAHNGVAALLLLATVSLNYASWRLA